MPAILQHIRHHGTTDQYGSSDSGEPEYQLSFAAYRRPGLEPVPQTGSIDCHHPCTEALSVRNPDGEICIVCRQLQPVQTTKAYDRFQCDDRIAVSSRIQMPNDTARSTGVVVQRIPAVATLKNDANPVIAPHSVREPSAGRGCWCGHT